MLRTLMLAITAIAATLTLAPTAQASPGCADYIKVCARPGATSTGGGGDSPFYSSRINPVTHQRLHATCTSGCSHIPAADRDLVD